MMANTTSNSNFVNILDLPQSQFVLDTDLVLLQTLNGTQTITFDNLNVVKTDINGNAALQAGLTGNNAVFTTITLQALSSAAYFSAGQQGINKAIAYNNRFTMANGLVTSADYVQGSPEYTALYNLIAATSAVGNRYEYAGQVTILAAASTSSQVNIYNVPVQVGTNLLPWHFSLMPVSNMPTTDYPSLSAVPRIDNLTYNSGTFQLSFKINTTRVLPAVNYIYYRILYFY